MKVYAWNMDQFNPALTMSIFSYPRTQPRLMDLVDWLDFVAVTLFLLEWLREKVQLVFALVISQRTYLTCTLAFIILDNEDSIHIYCLQKFCFLYINFVM